MTAPQSLTTIVSTKGQVILPKPVREHRNWPVGTRLIVEETADGVLLRPAPVFVATDIDGVFGSLPYNGPAISVEQMADAIAAEAVRRHDGD